MRSDFTPEILHADLGKPGAPGHHRLAYATAGQGTPLLFLHGSLCDLRYWKYQMPPLARCYQTYSVSLRHHWPENWNGDGDDFSLQQHVDDMAVFLQEFAEGRAAHVVGHSRGGRVAFELARQHPALVRSLVLADPGLSVNDEEDRRGDFRMHAMEAIRAGDIEGGLALFIDTVTGPDTWRRMVPWFKDMVIDNASTLLGQGREGSYRLQESAARALDKPVLLIGGALSPAPYPAILDILQNLLPNVRRLDVPGSSHGMNLGNPRAFNHALLDFLAACEHTPVCA